MVPTADMYGVRYKLKGGGALAYKQAQINTMNR